MVQRDGLFKRGKIWWVRTDPITGKQISTGQTERKQALLWRAERQRRAGDPHQSAAEKATLGEWIRRTLAVKQSDRSEATMGVYRQKLGHFARIWGLDLSLAKITPDLCDSYVEQRRCEAGDHTICKEFSALSQLLKLARRSGCYSGQIEALRPTDVSPRYKPRTRALSPDEVVALLRELRNPFLAMVTVAVCLGTRLSESLRFAPTDLDREAWTATIRGTKTEGAHRVVPVLPPFRELLASVLPQLPIGPIYNVRRRMLEACARAKIAPCTPNDLRRTHATLLISAGVDRDVVRRLLGHTTSTMVERVYGKPSAQSLGDLAAPKLVGLLLSGRENATKSATVETTGKGEDDENTGKQGAPETTRTSDLGFRKPYTDQPKTPEEPTEQADHGVLNRPETERTGPKWRNTDATGLKRPGLDRAVLRDLAPLTPQECARMGIRHSSEDYPEPARGRLQWPARARLWEAAP
jgi:integrase